MDLLTVHWFSTLILAFLKQPWTRNGCAVSVIPQWSLHGLRSRRARFSLGIWDQLSANRAVHVCIFTLHQLKLIQISPFWESLCQEICLALQSLGGHRKCHSCSEHGADTWWLCARWRVWQLFWGVCSQPLMAWQPSWSQLQSQAINVPLLRFSWKW